MQSFTVERQDEVVALVALVLCLGRLENSPADASKAPAASSYEYPSGNLQYFAIGIRQNYWVVCSPTLVCVHRGLCRMLFEEHA